jgi:hypothetical protein
MSRVLTAVLKEMSRVLTAVLKEESRPIFFLSLVRHGEKY